MSARHLNGLARLLQAEAWAGRASPRAQEGRKAARKARQWLETTPYGTGAQRARWRAVRTAVERLEKALEDH